MLWNSNIEKMDRKGMQELQLERLKETIANVYGSVPFYRDMFDKNRIKPEDIKNDAYTEYMRLHGNEP